MKKNYIVIGIMCFALVLGICVQIGSVKKSKLAVAQTVEENEIRGQILQAREKYEKEYKQLEKKEIELEEERNNSIQNNTEFEIMKNKIDNMQKMIGTVESKGSGVIVTLADGKYEESVFENPSSVLVHDLDLLSVINELKNAGAEAISVNGQRVITSSSIQCGGNIININGEKVGAPFKIKAIGLPEQLAGVSRPGGVLDRLSSFYGVYTKLEKKDEISIPKYEGTIKFVYANTID